MDGQSEGAWEGNDSRALTAAEARRELCSGIYGLQSACHKLFSADVGAGLSFDEDISHGEDRLYVYRYLQRCETVVFLDAPLWRIRARAASASRSPLDQSWMDMASAMDRIIDMEADAEIACCYRRERMEIIILYIAAYLYRQSRDPAFYLALRQQAREGLRDYRADGASRHDLIAAGVYAWCPTPLLRCYLRLKGKPI